MRITLQPAYVLHARPYRNTSALVELLTPEHGRVGAVARGARGPRSRLRAVLQPFRPLLVSWTGGGDLATLTGGEEAGRGLRLSYRGTVCGWYMNELVVRLTERRDPHPALFRAYVDTVGRLHDEAACEPALRCFETALLNALGYGLVLARDADHDTPVRADGVYDYQLERGPVAATGPPNALRVSGRTLLALARGEPPPDPEALREAKRLLRAALGLYLGGRPLKTRELLASARPQP